MLTDLHIQWTNWPTTSFLVEGIWKWIKMYVILFLGQKGDCGAETAARKKTRRMALDNGGIFAWSACPGGVIIISNNQKSPPKNEYKI